MNVTSNELKKFNNKYQNVALLTIIFKKNGLFDTIQENKIHYIVYLRLSISSFLFIIFLRAIFILQ